MPTPFPGMDPYLENPHLWPGVHLGLLSAIWTDLAPRLSPRYIVAVEERTYIAAIEPRSFIGRPDVLIGPAATLSTAGHRMARSSRRRCHRACAGRGAGAG